jgi:hypothetical protein
VGFFEGAVAAERVDTRTARLAEFLLTAGGCFHGAREIGFGGIELFESGTQAFQAVVEIAPTSFVGVARPPQFFETVHVVLELQQRGFLIPLGELFLAVLAGVGHGFLGTSDFFEQFVYVLSGDTDGGDGLAHFLMIG